MSGESCESCGVVAELHTVAYDDDIEPFRVCARCRPQWRPVRLPFGEEQK